MEILNNLFGTTANSDIVLTVITTWILVQVVKPIILNTKYIPLVSALIGGIAGAVVAFNTKDASVLEDAVLGVVAGFAATGVNETFTKSFSSLLVVLGSKVSDLFENKGTNETADTTEDTVDKTDNTIK